MKIKIMTIFLFLSLFLLILFISVGKTYAAVNIEECRTCHQIVKPLVNITKDCQVCHEHHGGGEPSTRDIYEVHPRHLSVDEGGKNQYCYTCHTTTPVDCKNCHYSHDINNLVNNLVKPNSNSNNSNNLNSLNNLNNSNNSNNRINNNNNSINNNNNSINLTDYSVCQNCHGPLPTPYGHEEFRDGLKNSKHNWMNCQTCHIPPFRNSNNVDLHFKDLMGTPINASINLCKVCHSSEYKELVKGTHGTINNTCVDCHNPHTTSIGGNPKLIISKKGNQENQQSINITGMIGDGTNWLTTKFPILNNSMAMAIILILIAATTSEYILSKHEEGKKVAYKMVKIQADENTLKTLEIKLENQNIASVNDILKDNGIDVLGMTMTKDDANIYDYVIFVNIGRNEEIEGIKLIEKISKEISSLDDVNSVEVTDRYEL